MPSPPRNTTWKAAPHTLAKIRILSGYLGAWAQILGRTRARQDLVYVDGFAGPGEYTNSPEGSPMAALRALAQTRAAAGENWKAGNIYCAFIERDVARYKHLHEKVASFGSSTGIQVLTLNRTFVDGLAEIRTRFPQAFSGRHPLFAFIDPFGATGVPFETVADILTSPCSEVLLNLDADGIARIHKAGSAAADTRNLSRIFGDETWRTVLDDTDALGVTCRKVLELYKRRLCSLPRVEFVYSFGMRARGNLHNYHLVFASQHSLGLKKMKESMRACDQTGDYEFIDTLAAAGSSPLIRFDHHEDWGDQLAARFAGLRVLWDELERFALTETPFPDPKKMLALLENQGRIAVESRKPDRRKGTFPEGKIRAVKFL